MADKSTSGNEKYFFRNESISSSVSNVPRDLLWAVKDLDYNIGDYEGNEDNSVSSIEYLNGDTSYLEQPGTGHDEYAKCPTPIISELISQTVYQNDEGAARVNVVLGIQCIDNVKYNVRVTAV